MVASAVGAVILAVQDAATGKSEMVPTHCAAAPAALNGKHAPGKSKMLLRMNRRIVCFAMGRFRLMFTVYTICIMYAMTSGQRVCRIGADSPDRELSCDQGNPDGRTPQIQSGR